MRVKDFKLLVRCVEEAVEYGYKRAHKHTDSPTEDQIRHEIENAIVDEICEWFIFDEVETYEQVTELH